MEIIKDYDRFKSACESFRSEFSDAHFTAGRLFCHPLLDGVIYAPIPPDEAKSNSTDVCRMSDMLLMSADGEKYLPFKIAEARKIAEENGEVYIANLLYGFAFAAQSWMIDGKHDTVIISEEHMKKEGKPYAPVTPLTNVIQPFKKFTNHFLYKKGTLEEPAVLSDKDITGRLDSYLDSLLIEVVSPEIINETEFEIFGEKISCDKNESRCAEVDKALRLIDRLETEMSAHIPTFKSAGVELDLSGFTAKLLSRAAAKCGAAREEKDFTGSRKELEDKFRKTVSEKNSYGFKYVPADTERFAGELKAAELSSASPEELKKDIAAMLTVRPALPAVFNMARAVSPADAEAVENISAFWGSEALSPADLAAYLENAYISPECRSEDGKFCCGGIKASLIAGDIRAAAGKYKLKALPVLEELEKYCEDYEKETRTYNGTVFDSVAEMEKAVKNEAELAEKCSDLSALDENELKQLRKYIYDMPLDRKTTGKYLLKIKLALLSCEENRLKLLCTGLTLKKTEELDALLKKIADEGFDEVLAAPYKAKIADAVLSRQAGELAEMFKNIPDNARADSLEASLRSGKYDKMFIRPYTAKIADARDGFARKELETVFAGIDAADENRLADMSARLDAVKCRDSLKAPYRKKIAERKQAVMLREVEAAFAGIAAADKAKLDVFRGIIASGKYPAALTDKYKSQIETRAVQIENAEFIKKCETIPQMNRTALDEILTVLKSGKYPKEMCDKYLAMAAERAKALIKSELDLLCKDIASMDTEKLDTLEKALANEKYPPELTADHLRNIKARRRAVFNTEADALCKNISSMQKPELKELSEKLKDEKFDQEYVKKYYDEIEKRFDKIETDKLEDMCRDIGKLKTPELEKLSKEIEGLSFKKENTAPYLEKIRKVEIDLMKAEMENLCKNIGSTPRSELSKLKEALESGGFDKELSAKYLEKIELRTNELIKQELAELCKNIATAPKDKLLSMKLKINDTPEYKEPGKAYAEQIESRLKQLDKAEFDKQMASIANLNADDLDRFEEELEKRKPALDPKLYEASAEKCRERREFLEKQELEKICADIAGADLKRLHEIRETITEGGFTPTVTFPYLKKVNDAMESRHVEYYTKITANIANMSRAELFVLLEKINKNENHASDDMLQRYIGRVNAKIREADAAMLAEKCRNLGSMSEHRCFELIKDINEMDIDNDTKKRFITQVELNITNLKTMQRDEYVTQLKALMDQNLIKESQFYIPNISKSFENAYIKVQNAYASVEQFEMPILIHECTAGHTEDSYLLTTRYLYSMGKGGLAHIAIDQIERFEGKAGLFGSSLKVVEKNGKSTDLPSNIDKKLYEGTAKVLNGVLALIQKDKAAAKLREAEEIKAAEEAKLKALEEERQAIEAARKKAEAAEKLAASPAPAPVPVPTPVPVQTSAPVQTPAAVQTAGAEKKEPAAEKKPEPLKPIKPIEVVVSSPIPDVKPIKPIEGENKPEDKKPVPVSPAPAAKPAPVQPVKPVTPAAAPVTPVKPVTPAAAAPVTPVKPVTPAAAPVTPVKPVTPVPAVKPAAPAAPAKPAQPAAGDDAKLKIRFCDQCGAKIPNDTAKFCMECGNKLIH